MSKVRVPLHGKPHGYATLDTEATRGAVVGVNLFWPDGRTVVTEAALAAAAGAPPPGEGATVFWRAIQEIPVNVSAVAGLAGSGFVRRNGDAWSAGPIVNADLENASTDGLQEGADNRYFTAARAQDAAGAILDDTGDVELHFEDAPERRIWGELSPEVRTSLEAADGAVQADEPVLDPLPPDAPDDAAAALAGVPVGGLYRDGSVLMIRVV